MTRFAVLTVYHEVVRSHLRFGLRQFRRNRVFAAALILLLAIGIGANTLVFSLMNELLLKPLPVRNAANLYLLEKNRPQQIRPDPDFEYTTFERVARADRVFASAVAEQYGTELLPYSEGSTVRVVTAQVVSPNYFSELGIPVAVGRALSEADAEASSDIPVVLSDQFWRAQFAGRRDILGRHVRLKDFPFLVVGVVAGNFHSVDLDRAPDVRLPISAARVLRGHAVDAARAASPFHFRILTRLAAGADPAQAASLEPELRDVEDWNLRQHNAALARPVPPDKLAGYIRFELDYRLALEPVGRGISRIRDQFARSLRLLMGGVVLLLLAVCANIAGLLAAKSAERSKEIAVRLAVGASSGQISRQLLAENLLPAVPGALLGGAWAVMGARYILRFLPPVRDDAQLLSPQILSVTPDLRVLLFTAAITTLCLFGFGALPAWRAPRLALAAQLRGRRHQRFPGMGPVALQVGLTVVLLSAAAIMLRTFANLERANPGFDRGHIVEFTFDPLDAGYTAGQSGAFFRDLLEQVGHLAGVRSAAYADRGVMRGVGEKTTTAPEGVVLPKSTFMNTSLNLVSAGYFAAMGIPLLAGRDLEESDAGKLPSPIVVNEALARLFFPGQSPLGKHLAQGADGTKDLTRIIVGVAATSKYRSLRETDPPTWYGLEPPSGDSRLLYVRTYRAPAGIVSAVRALGRRLAPAVPLVEVFTLEDEIQASLWQERLIALMAAFFALVAVTLAGIGLYGTLAFSVGRRTKELGIRLAIGARMRDIVSTVCGPAVVALACGLIGGLALSAWLLRFAEHLLFGVRTFDPVSFAAAAGFIGLVAAAAAAIPARRAVRIPPASALREE